MLVRNLPDAGSLNEAEPDSGDFRILGESNSGVLSGGEVTASAPESMTVNVAAAEVVIDGTPYSFTSQALTLTPASGGFPRFDLVGWTSAGPGYLTGEASGNARFPAFDPKVFVVAAAVYIDTGATAIAQAQITEKVYRPLVTFKRRWANETDAVFDWTTPAQANGFKALTNGSLQWVNSVLRRTGSAAMEWVTTLTLKQSATTAIALILKAASGAGATHKLLDVRGGSSDTSLASINALGQFVADNFKRGTGSPAGAVSGNLGDFYIDQTATNGNLALWFKTVNGGTSGWVSFRVYSASESSLPTGAIIPWTGEIDDPIPSGFSLCTGGNLAVNASTQDLADLIGTKFGTAPEGFVKLPDLRNRVLGGASTAPMWPGIIDETLTVGTTLGQNAWQLTGSQVPLHSHPVNDPGHVHPQEGPRWYYKPGIWGFPAFRPGGTGTPTSPGQWVEDQWFDRRATTGISIGNYGGGEALVMLQATFGVNWLIKW